MAAFAASFFQYLIIMIILIAIAIAGVVLGIRWRKSKDARTAAETAEADIEATTAPVSE